MKRKILMLAAGAAMLLSMAAVAADNGKDNGCCKCGNCVKACSSKCVCDSKKCTPETCKSTTCPCHK